MGAAFITKRYTMPDEKKVIEFHVKIYLLRYGIQQVRRSISPLLLFIIDRLK